MLDYSLLLATQVTDPEVVAATSRVMTDLGGEPAEAGTLVAHVRPITHPVSSDVYAEILGVRATARVYLGVDNKIDDEVLYAEARRRLCTVSAALARELDAQACLTSGLDKIVMRRDAGELALFDWFPEWSDEQVLATLRDPYRVTDEPGNL